LTQQAGQVQITQVQVAQPQGVHQVGQVDVHGRGLFRGKDPVEERDIDDSAQQADIVGAVEPSVQDAGRALVENVECVRRVARQLSDDAVNRVERGTLCPKLRDRELEPRR